MKRNGRRGDSKCGLVPPNLLPPFSFRRECYSIHSYRATQQTTCFNPEDGGSLTSRMSETLSTTAQCNVTRTEPISEHRLMKCTLNNKPIGRRDAGRGGTTVELEHVWRSSLEVEDDVTSAEETSWTLVITGSKKNGDNQNTNIILSRWTLYMHVITGDHQYRFELNRTTDETFAFIKYWRRNGNIARQYASYL